MAELLKRFLNICLLSNGPQDLPCSHILLQILSLLYFIVALVSWLVTLELQMALLASVVDVAFLIVFIRLIVGAFGKTTRFVQTVSAMLGIGIIFQTLGLPLMQIMAVDREQANGEVVLLIIALYSWNLAVFAHILREAVSIRLATSFVITLVYVVLTTTSYQFFFSDWVK
jgi:hypothetical protein